MKKKKGFTLVELLAVIVILAIILVIAVPQIMKTIDESREGTFISSAKLIAASAEREYLVRKTLDDTEFTALTEMDCADVVEVSEDYEDCKIQFDSEGNATVKLEGNGKFEGKYVCAGTREEAVITEEKCGLVALITEEKCGLVALIVDPNGGTNTVEYNEKYIEKSTVTLMIPTAPEGKRFVRWEVTPEDAKVSENILTMGTSATTVKAIWKEIGPTGVETIKALCTDSTTCTANGLINPTATNGDDEYNTGIRYTGSNPNNYVWFNCADSYVNGTDTINYGDNGYEYNNTNCELWRIIGVFDVEGTERVKIINRSSTFSASWDSSARTVNSGYGVNQWGEVKDANENTTYEGADIMRLLNGYYIKRTAPDYVRDENNPSTLCKYNNSRNNENLEQECDTSTSPLSDNNMKPLTQLALKMIGNAKWYTYATDSSTASTAYLQERGITKTYTGCSNLEASTPSECTADGVTRENEWTGKVGLMYASDIMYANGWLHNKTYYSWAISPLSYSGISYGVWLSYSSFADNSSTDYSLNIWPTVYLNQNVEIIGSGDNLGTSSNPYILSL